MPSFPGSAAWAPPLSATGPSSSGRGRPARTLSPSTSAETTIRSPTRASACAARASRRPPATTTGTCWTASACPTPPAAGSPRACAAPRASSTRRPSRGPTRAGTAARRCATLSSTSCTSARSPRRGRSRRRSNTFRAWPSSGVTHIEVMPVAEFPGARGWGYDGVYISAAQSSYGGPEGFARLVDAAHAAGLGVILDVVYNHLGASGDQAIAAFGPYFTDKYGTFWGEAINYDDTDSDAVREWVLQSAEGWIRDFHVDGLRLDAIHAIFDQGARHIMREVADRVHGVNPRALVIAESGLNDPKVTRPPDEGGWDHDGQWADDFHHALRVLLTGDRNGYYEEFGDIAQLGQGLPAPVRARRRLLDLPPAALRRPRRRPPGRRVRRLRPEPRPGRQPRPRRPHAARGARAGRLRDPAVAVRADALHGRGARRAGALPVLHRPHRQGDRGGDARGAPARVRVVRGLRRRGGPRSAGRGDLPALEAHAPWRPGAARPLQAAARGPPRAAGGDRGRRRRLRRRAPPWLRVRRGPFVLAANFGADEAGVPAGDAARSSSPPTRRAWTTARSCCPAARERCCDERARALARQALPARRDVGRPGHELRAVHRERRRRDAVPVRRRRAPRSTSRSPSVTAHHWHVLRARASGPASATASASRVPTTPEEGHRFNPHKLLIDPYAKAIEGAVRWDAANVLPYMPDGTGDADLERDDEDDAEAMPEVDRRRRRASTGRATARRAGRGTRPSSTRRTCAASRCATRRCARTCAAPTPGWPPRRRSAT